MPSANRDRVTLHYEDIGTGRPVLFLREYGGDYRSWAQQETMQSSDYHCIVARAGLSTVGCARRQESIRPGHRHSRHALPARSSGAGDVTFGRTEHGCSAQRPQHGSGMRGE